jgi:hypothetical protein
MHVKITEAKPIAFDVELARTDEAVHQPELPVSEDIEPARTGLGWCGIDVGLRSRGGPRELRPAWRSKTDRRGRRDEEKTQAASERRHCDLSPLFLVNDL